MSGLFDPKHNRGSGSAHYVFRYLLDVHNQCQAQYEPNRYRSFALRQMERGLRLSLVENLGYTHREINQFLNCSDELRVQRYPEIMEIEI